MRPMRYENQAAVTPHEHCCESCHTMFVCASDAVSAASGAVVHYGYLNRGEFCRNPLTEAARVRSRFCNPCLQRRIYGIAA